MRWLRNESFLQHHRGFDVAAHAGRLRSQWTENGVKKFLGWIGLAMCAMASSGVGVARAADAWLDVSQRLSPHGATSDFTPHGTQPGLLFNLWKSDDCAGCHGAGGSGSALAFRPHSTWAGSMMANATRDPLFMAALDIANHDVPGVGDYCLRCHASDGWYGGHVVKTHAGQPDNDVTLGAAACLLAGSYERPDGDSDYGGLSCHFCHRNMGQGANGEPLPRNGAVWLNDTDCDGAGGPCRYGPYDDYDPSGPQPPHPWQKAAFVTDSAMCGQCHDVTTPDTPSGPLKTLKLANGTDTGIPFPIERTFSEWQRSAFSNPMSGRTCQSCHMPSSEDPDATACSLGGYPNRSGNLPVHAFVGGNTWVPGIIKGEYSDTTSIPGAWEGIGRQASFDQTVAWARDMLASAATVGATVSAYVAPTAARAGSIGVSVKVTNQSGHKLPTGYGEGRRMWLNVQLHDAGGNLVAESGAYDPATAILTNDAQARVYEVLQGIWNHNGNGHCDVADAGGDPMFHFALNDCVAKDNRIPPLGFTPSTAGDPNGYEVRPVGATYAETAPGSGTLVNYDKAAYTFAIPAGRVGPFTATARLYYQTSSKEYIEFLRNEAADNAFAGENQMCGGAADRPFVVGPKDRTRGQFVYELWNNAANDPNQRGYGKSPPELVGVASEGSGDRIFVDGFDAGSM